MIRMLFKLARLILFGRKRKFNWNAIVVQPVDSDGVCNRNCPKCGQDTPCLVLKYYGNGEICKKIEIDYRVELDLMRCGCHRCKAKWFERPEDWKHRSY